MSVAIFDQLTDEQLRNAERELANRKRELEHARWDAELVGRYFRVIRSPENTGYRFLSELARFQGDDYVTLERTLGVGAVDTWGHPSDYVYADVVFIHIRQRDDNELTCSGFEVSHANRREPYLKIQPVFYSYDDFRKYSGSFSHHTGPTKHFDEISKAEYEVALTNAVSNFAAPPLTQETEQ